MKTIEQKLNEEIDKIKMPHPDRYNDGKMVGFEQGFLKAIAFAQRWIPIEEEIPEKGYYLVKLSDNTTMYAQFNSFGKWLIFWFGGCDNQDINRPITHFRPIELT